MAALLCPPRNEELRLSNPFVRLRDRWRNQSPRRQELLLAAAALAFGFLLLPWFIWLAGQAFLGPYASDSVWRFLGDFYTGLAHGPAVFWAVALGPLAFLLLLRGLIVVASTPKP